MFITAATDNVINIWDVRTPAVIGRYNGHINRREQVKCAISPCHRFISVGSEDKSLRILDVRQSYREISKVTNAHKDVVIDTKWNPVFPYLMSAGLDGKVAMYAE
jgi:WD40 repeat protein